MKASSITIRPIEHDAAKSPDIGGFHPDKDHRTYRKWRHEIAARIQKRKKKILKNWLQSKRGTGKDVKFLI